MDAGELDLDIFLHCDFSYTLTWEDDDGPMDLSGWGVEAMVRHPLGGALIVDLAPEITDAGAGEISISITDEQTAELTPGTYRWDLILITPAGERLPPVLAGKATVRTPQTHPE